MSENLSVGEIRRIWRLCIDHLITGRTDEGEGRRRPGDRRRQRGRQGEVPRHLVPVVVPPEGAQRGGRRRREGAHRGAEGEAGNRPMSGLLPLTVRILNNRSDNSKFEL